MNWLKSLIIKLAQKESINYLLKANPSLFKEYQDKKNSIIIPEVYSGEAGEILKKWIFYRSKQGDNINLNGLDVVLVNPADKSKTWFIKPNFTFSDLQKKNEEYHEKLKETENRTYTPKYPISILKQYPNGLAWGRLETSYCDSYGKSLGHCGNVNGRYNRNQRIYTFYDTTTNIHYLTFIYNKGMLGEAKAYGNSKPPIDKIRIINREDLQSVNAQEVYKDLLLLKDKDQYIWQNIRGGGYKPENNFQFNDLNEKDRQEVKNNIPTIDDYFSYRMGKDSKELYFTEDDEIYFNKNITREQFKELILRNIELTHYNKTLYYIVKFNLQNDKEVIETIDSLDSYTSYNLAKALNFDKIPKEIIKSISRNPVASFDFVKEMDSDLNKIPKEIIDGIATSPDYSSLFIKRILDKYKDWHKIPENIIDSVATSSLYSFTAAEASNYDLKKIPAKLINAISQDEKQSFLMAIELIKANDEIPDALISGISISEAYSYSLAKELGFDLDKIPKKIIESISRSSKSSYNFLMDLTDMNNIPEEIIDGVSKDARRSYFFAMKLEFNLDIIPKKIIEGISIDPDYSWKLAYKLDFDLSRIPKIIIKSIKEKLEKNNLPTPDWMKL